jgi:predicted hydrocarbon binding protein
MAGGSARREQRRELVSEKADFEQAWLARLSNRLQEVAGDKVRDRVMSGSEGLSSRSSPLEVIGWSRGAMERLEALVEPAMTKAIMTGCACQYPKAELQEIRRAYAATGDVAVAHAMLQEQFESFLRGSLNLSDERVAEVVSKGWGLAGVREGDTIVATKIPKSGHLVEYLSETDPEKRRQRYCHCPRVRDAVRLSETIPPTYCYCGAGFCKGIWEEILQEPIEVEVQETVLEGGDVCRIAIRLPAGERRSSRTGRNPARQVE